MSDLARRPFAPLGVALALFCWPVWWIAGILAGWADLIVRVVAIFAFLTLVETLSGRLTGT